jgi:branched-chain amino acid transport system permease protein
VKDECLPCGSFRNKILRCTWVSVPYVVMGGLLLILPPFLSTFVQSLMTKVLIFGVFAMSLNLIWGYTGLISLGHAAFFGGGGYTAGILITRFGFESFWLVAPTAVLVTAVLAGIIGYISLRVSGMYFLLITMAMGQLLYGVAVKWRSMTGGSMGLYGVSYPNLGLSFVTMNPLSFYYVVLIVSFLCFLLIWKITSSPFGYALQGIREDELRMRHLGYNTWLYKYIAVILSGLVAGAGGVLFIHYNRIVVPDHLGVITSAMAVLMVIIGGERVVFGPFVGAAVIVFLEHYSSIYVPQRWPLILGGVFALAVMFLRGGISVHLVKAWEGLGYRYGSSQD